MKLESTSEKRKDPRYSLNKITSIKNVSDNSENMLNNITVNLENISLSGIGFKSEVQLKLNHFYDFEITLWNDNKVSSAVEIVRINKLDDGVYFYGGIFIGLSQMDQLNIRTYEILS